MMESAHPGAPPTPDTDETDELFDQDPFKSISSSNLDDLALDDDDENDANDGNNNNNNNVGAGVSLTDDELNDLTKDIAPIQVKPNATTPAGCVTVNAVATGDAEEAEKDDDDEEEDPWAVLAAAAGTAGNPAPTNSSTTPASTLTSSESDPIDPISASAATIQTDNTSPHSNTNITHTTTTTTTYSHAQGENFSIETGTPIDSNNNANSRLPPELATLTKNIQSSALHLQSVLSTKIHQVDEKTDLSQKVHQVKSNFETTTRNIDEKIHVSEKWNEFKTNVWKPTTEKTKEVTLEVGKSVGPSVKEGWGVVSKSVVGWKEKMAAVGVGGSGDGGNGSGVGQDGGKGAGGEHMNELEKYAEGENNEEREFNELSTMGDPTTAPPAPASAAGTATTPKEALAQSIGQLGQKAQELNLSQKWASISSTVGTKWQSAAAGMEQWKEEHKKKLAAESGGMNVNGPFEPHNYSNNNSGGSNGHNNNNLHSDPVSAKVRESFAGGLGWVSKRIQEVKSQHAAPAAGSNTHGTEMQDMNSDKEVKRMDSDGLPSSFFKE